MRFEVECVNFWDELDSEDFQGSLLSENMENVFTVLELCENLVETLRRFSQSCLSLIQKIASIDNIIFLGHVRYRDRDFVGANFHFAIDTELGIIILLKKIKFS